MKYKLQSLYSQGVLQVPTWNLQDCSYRPALELQTRLYKEQSTQWPLWEVNPTPKMQNLIGI